MRAPFANKVAMVAGASRGIGQATAETLAANGANIVVILFLTSNEANWITGQTLRVNGGFC